MPFNKRIDAIERVVVLVVLAIGLVMAIAAAALPLLR